MMAINITGRKLKINGPDYIASQNLQYIISFAKATEKLFEKQRSSVINLNK